MRRLCVGGLIGFMIGGLLFVFLSANLAVLAWSVALGVFLAWLSETAPGPESRRSHHEEECRRILRDLRDDLVKISERIRYEPRPTVYRPRPKWPPKPSDN